jgi:hypothetical protein
VNHKRGRRKDRRAGCLLCKPHKSNAQKGREESQTWQERKARISEREKIRGGARSAVDRGTRQLDATTGLGRVRAFGAP